MFGWIDSGRQKEEETTAMDASSFAMKSESIRSLSGLSDGCRLKQNLQGSRSCRAQEPTR